MQLAVNDTNMLTYVGDVEEQQLQGLAVRLFVKIELGQDQVLWRLTALNIQILSK